MNSCFIHTFRRSLLGVATPLALSAALLFIPTSAVYAQADDVTVETVQTLDIPAQTLSQALQALASQTGLQMVFSAEITNGKQAPAVSGDLTPRAALELLLQGSGLEYEVINDRTIMVKVGSRSSNSGASKGGARVIENARVEEVFVTARKREESVQDVPIAITAFTAADMKSAGITNVSNMEGVVPGLNMSGGGNGVKRDSNPFIRGVGQRETKVTVDPAVGTYIDGIYLARTAGALLDTVGMERVEVLRGPQGTLFGKNVTGGAISFTTKKPYAEFGASVGVNVGNFGRSDASVVLNGPIVDEKLMGRLTIAAKNSDGFFTNIVDNTKWGNDNRVTGIGQLRWVPNEEVMVDLLTERTRIRESPRPLKCVEGRPIDPYEDIPDPNNPWDPDSFLGGLLGERSWNRTRGLGENPNYFYPTTISNTDVNRLGTNSNYPTEIINNPNTYKGLCQQSQALPTDKFASDMSEFDTLLDKGRYWIDTATLGLTTTWDIGDIGPLNTTTFKSITAWRKVEQIADEDLDGVAAPYLLRVQPDFNETSQISQEIQFTGLALDDRLFFSTGLFYFKEKTPQDTLVRTAGIGQRRRADDESIDPGLYEMGALEPTREVLETDNETYAWYGQVDYSLTPLIDLTFGLRYTHEERWSRYEKAFAIPASMILGEPAGVSDLETGGAPGGRPGSSTTIRSDAPGLANIADWEFFGPGSSGYGSEAKSTTDVAWTPMASVKFNFGELLSSDIIQEAMAYFTYSEGFKGGGVTAGALDSDNSSGVGGRIEEPIIFEPETVNNYEVGVKLQAFERRLQANTAIFYTDYRDMQVTSTVTRFGIPIPFIDNVGKSVIQGFEGEFIFLPTANSRVMFNLAYTDADMKVWDAQRIQLNPFTGAPTGQYDTVDRSDEPLPRVPEWQAYAMADYSFSFRDGSTVTPLIAARYMSEIYHGFDRGSFVYAEDLSTSDPVVIMDARVTYLSPDQKLEIALWVKNLTDKQDHMVGAIPLVETTGTVGQIYGDPRTFGLTMNYMFGAE